MPATMVGFWKGDGPVDPQVKIPFSSRRSLDAGQPTFAEFFAGIGLMRLGLESAGWRIGWANDIDAMKHRLYDANFGDAGEHFCLADVHKISGQELPPVDLATASFPCTDLSLAGSRKGIHAGESSAFWGFRDVVASMRTRPSLILLENVPGFLTSHGGRDFHNALQALNEIGYAVDPFFLDAKWFVPQSRLRLFVVGELNGPPSSGDGRASRVRPQAIQEFIASNPDIKWGIRDIPEPPLASATDLKDIVENIPPTDKRWWNATRVEYLRNQMSEKHGQAIDELIKRRAWSYGTVFRRVRKQADGLKRSMAELRLDGIAGCLRTPKGGSGRQILVKAGYGQMLVRLLTPVECSRLMGADSFVVSGSETEALFGFGDAVCVSAVTWIANNRLCHVKSARSNSGKAGLSRLVS